MGSRKNSAKVGIWANNSNLSQLKMQKKKMIHFCSCQSLVNHFSFPDADDNCLNLRLGCASWLHNDNEDNDDDLGFGYVIHDMCGCSVADCKTWLHRSSNQLPLAMDLQSTRLAPHAHTYVELQMLAFVIVLQFFGGVSNILGILFNVFG